MVHCVVYPKDKSAIHRFIVADMSQIGKASGEIGVYSDNLLYVLCATRFWILFFSFGSLTRVQSSSILGSSGLSSDDDVEGILELFRRFRFGLFGGYSTHEGGDGKLADGSDGTTVGNIKYGETGSAAGATGCTEMVVELAGKTDIAFASKQPGKIARHMRCCGHKWPRQVEWSVSPSLAGDVEPNPRKAGRGTITTRAIGAQPERDERICAIMFKEASVHERVEWSSYRGGQQVQQPSDTKLTGQIFRFLCLASRDAWLLMWLMLIIAGSFCCRNLSRPFPIRMRVLPTNDDKTTRCEEAKYPDIIFMDLPFYEFPVVKRHAGRARSTASSPLKMSIPSIILRQTNAP